MTPPRPAHPTTLRRRRRRRRTAALLAVAILALVTVVWQTARPLTTRLDLAALTGLGDSAPGPTAPEAGTTGDAVTADTPATGLDPELQRRFDAAQAAAAAEGVDLTITSGWRSADEQQRLVDEAIARYGSVDEAHRWVLPPETSAHVAGLAIDVGGTEGAYWLTEHGPEYGLCQTYANEVWHFEPLAAGATNCPEKLEDALWGW